MPKPRGIVRRAYFNPEALESYRTGAAHEEARLGDGPPIPSQVIGSGTAHRQVGFQELFARDIRWMSSFDRASQFRLRGLMLEDSAGMGPYVEDYRIPNYLAECVLGGAPDRVEEITAAYRKLFARAFENPAQVPREQAFYLVPIVIALAFSESGQSDLRQVPENLLRAAVSRSDDEFREIPQLVKALTVSREMCPVVANDMLRRWVKATGTDTKPICDLAYLVYWKCQREGIPYELPSDPNARFFVAYPPLVPEDEILFGPDFLKKYGKKKGDPKRDSKPPG